MKEARVSKLSELAVLRALGCNVSSAHTSSRADIIKRFAQDELTMAGSPSEFGPLSGPKGGMKMKLARIAFALVMVLIGVLGSSAFAQDPGWPRQITKPGGTLVYYQPQVDSWSNFEQLDWRMAISIAPAGGKEIVGALRMHGLTSVNSESQMVLISNLQITNTYFPSLSPADAASMDQLVRTFVPPTVWISMQRLVACVPKPATAPPGAQLNNDPPQIFVGYQPSILLSVEGQPVLADIPNTKLQYVVNTEWAVFVYDKSTYYLLAGQRWLTSSSPQGPWSPTLQLPKDFNKLLKDQQWASLKNFIPPSPASGNAVTPMVFYSTVPAVVILFNGQPVYQAIPGTQLVYATNTESYLFVYSPTNQFYYLTAGRWFTASSLQGPWTFATPNLPADFAQIPPDSPPAQVLSSVPGTEEAKDAVMIAQVPTRITVNPATAAASANVTYAGAPQFVPISGTSMSYATNTAQKVIQVGDMYYLCFQGIWFVSGSPQGPWQTADSVPQVIYTIPPSSPVYNVTYVTQVVAPGGTVQASYTAGYMGAFVVGVAVGAVVAGGTGYYYPPYVYHPAYGYPSYYGYPSTYGATSYYHSTTGAYGVSQTAYGAYGGSATRSASYNPYTGTYAHTASATTPYGHAAAGTAYNPYTGASAATKQGSNGYSSWGSSAVSKNGESAYSQHYSTAQGTTGSVQTSQGGKAVGASGAYGNSASAGKAANGNMYASADGNVYKNTGGGWQKYGSNGSWNSVNTSQQHPSSTSSASSYDQHPSSTSSASSYNQHPPSSTSSYQHPEGSDNMSSMNQEAQNRARGEQSSQRYSQYHGSGGGGRSWGGRR
jgi:hypothetical protein